MKVAVVGLGYWGPNHVRNLVGLNRCTGVVVTDLDPSKASLAAASHAKVTAAPDLQAVLDDPDVTAVIVSTPVYTHAEIARAVLLAGKSVLVEKPMTASTSDAEGLVALAQSKGLLVTAGHTFLFSPGVQTVTELIQRGEIGSPLYLQASRVNLGIHNSQVSVLWDLAPHDLSILFEWIREAPIRVSASGRSSHPGHPPDVAFVDVEFASGFIANLHVSWLAPTKIRRMTLVGTRRMVVYEDTHLEEPVKVYDRGLELKDPESFGEYQASYRTGDIISPRVPVWEPLRREIDEFMDRVSKGETPDAREQTAIAVVATIEAAEQSLRRNGEPVDL